MRNKKLLVLAVSILAANSVACSIQTESILAMQPGSELSVTVASFPDIVLELDGGIVAAIDVSLGFFDLLFGSVEGDVDIDELLFAAPSFDFLGDPNIPTEEVCVIEDPALPAVGTFEANIFGGEATFAMALSTIALFGNEDLAALLPGGGFPFAFDLESTVPMSLGDMLGLLTGSGSLEISESFDEDVEFDIGGLVLPAHLSGTLTLASVDTFPTSSTLDDCIAFLNE